MTKKFVLVLTALLCLHISLSYAQSKPTVTLHLDGVTMKEALRQLQQQSGMFIGYQSKDITSLPPVKFDCNNMPLEDALGKLLKGTSISYEVMGNNVVLKRQPGVAAPKSLADTVSGAPRNVHGRVLNEEQQGIPGITVMGSLSHKVAVTNDNGEYFIQVPAGETMLSFSSVSYQHRNVMLGADKQYNVTLKERVGTLQQVEVVSTGYVNLPKERATGSFGVMTAKQLEKIPVPNLLNRLEGQVAGVQLNLTESDNSFVYGNLYGEVEGNGSYTMTVRGATTTPAGGATGVSNKPLVVVDGFPTNIDIRTINPNDVEQVTFLKDAAAASIWGARASAGVIVITTKKGKAGDGAPHFSFSAGAGIYAKPRLNTLPLMNAAQMIDYEKELISRNYIYDPTLYTGASQRAITEVDDLIFQQKRGEITQADLDTKLAAISKLNNRSQVEQYLLQPASNQHYDLNINGGTDKHTYYLSGAYDKENTSAKGNSGERITLTANQQFKFFKNVTLDANLRGSWFRYNRGGAGVSVYAAGILKPYEMLADAQGNGIGYARAYYSGRLDQLEAAGYLPWRYNYLQEQALSDYTTAEANYTGTLSLNVPIYKGLSFNVQYMLEKSNSDTKNFSGDSTYYTRNLINSATSIDPNTGKLVYGIPMGGVLNLLNYNRNNYSARGQLNFDQNFKGKHQVNALAGMEVRQTIDGSSANTLYGYNTASQFSKPVDYSSYYVTVDGYYYTVPYSDVYTNQHRRFLSYLGNVAYTYNSKYTLSGSARYDDYNNFGVDRKYRAKPFWSAGVSWAIAKESFMQDVNWVNSLTLRATYGVNGNISSSVLPYDKVSLIPDYQQPFLTYAIIQSPSNPALKWEQTSVTNIGIDFSLFDNRLGGSAEVYYRKGSDLFATFPIDDTYGFSTLTRNTASMNSHGVDLGLNGKIIHQRNFEWIANVTFSYNTNKITDARFNVTSSLLNSGGVGGPIAGKPSDYFMAFRYKGLDKNGAPVIYGGDKTNGDTLTSVKQVTNINDLKMAGRTTPPYFGGLGQTFRYKRLSLYVLATYKFGYVIQRPTPGNYPGRYGLNNYEMNNLIDKRWRKAGDEAITNVPGLAGGSNSAYIRFANADINVLPGDHIRLREASLSYDLPEKVLGRTPVKGISITGTARNLFIIWRKNKDGLDPDFLPSVNSIKLPPSAAYSFSLNVNF
ncbi:SusC/RagA family TonB-linked outer membrane protein [Chitinophaga parva]|uniref:SusC/RagA family TonB-linked outer membrane protein n=1 Tax=Chitinophaga parva TaxID=2169414 RepID=A0A2T7BPW8_9BACT|nr:SusC/RagA family TonB-linked outer membrane protein [Chitinophaga parva]PUZ29716.1 SusC/RagA family TonB-linked outer membrane protein [Chitinophaga parva]